jgi:hypothetical protein
MFKRLNMTVQDTLGQPWKYRSSSELACVEFISHGCGLCENCALKVLGTPQVHGPAIPGLGGAGAWSGCRKQTVRRRMKIKLEDLRIASPPAKIKRENYSDKFSCGAGAQAPRTVVLPRFRANA